MALFDVQVEMSSTEDVQYLYEVFRMCCMILRRWSYVVKIAIEVGCIVEVYL